MLTCYSASGSCKSWFTLRKVSINMKSICKLYIEQLQHSTTMTMSIFVLTLIYKCHAISYLITWIAISLGAVQSWFWRKRKKSAFCRRLIDKFARTAESAGSLRLLVKRHVKVHFVASLQSNRNLECFIEPKSNHLSGLVISWLVWFANPIAAVKCGPCLVTE